MMEQRDRELLAAYLRQFQIEEAFPEALRPHLSLCRFTSGESICIQGDPASSLYLLAKGRIKVFATHAEGRTLIISMKSPFEAIGEIEYLRGIPMIHTVEAMTDVHMIRVPYRELDRHGRCHAPLLWLLLNVVAQKFELKSRSMNFGLLNPVEARLARHVLAVAEPAGRQLRVSAALLKDAASFIGTSDRHVNRVIRSWQTDGVVERLRDGLAVLDPERLQAMAGEGR